MLLVKSWFGEVGVSLVFHLEIGGVLDSEVPGESKLLERFCCCW